MAYTPISDFLNSPQTELKTIYGHLVSSFQIQNNLTSNPFIHCVLEDSVKGLSLSFRWDYQTLEVQDLIYKNGEAKMVAILSDEDKALLSSTLPIHFERVGVMVRKITKLMRSEWGREFKSEVLERNGYCGYMSREATDIERNCKTNIITHTLETMSKKRTLAFPIR